MTNDYMIYEKPEPGIARIVMNRPEAANAQDTQFLYELNAAFDRAAREDDVKVIILAANGKHFSSGHDLKTPAPGYFREGKTTLESAYGWETEHYLGFSRKWRDVPKPSIAAVQGACVAGALNVIWPCDLIVAADNAYFSDPAARARGCCAQVHHQGRFRA